MKVDSDMSSVENQKVSEKRGRTYVQWLYAGLTSTTIFTYGLQLGWVSPMTKVLQSAQSPTGAPLTDSELAWVGSSLAMTAAVGVSLYSYIVDAYGRKWGVVGIAIPQTLCWIVKLFATSIPLLLLGRVFAGIATGGCFTIVPMYIKEISQDNIRGSVVSMVILMQYVGLFTMYALGGYLQYYTVLYIVLPLSVVTTVLIFFATESPAFLVKKERYEEAAKTTARLRSLDVNDKIVQAEVEGMKKEDMHYKSLPKITFLNIFKNKAWRKAYILSMFLITCQAANGNYTIMMYAWSIMAASGVSVSPELQSLIVPSLMICGSLVSIALVERTGRKMLLGATYALTMVALITLGTSLLIQSKGGYFPSWLPALAIAASVWSYGAGVLPMTHVIMSEMFNFQVRAKLIGCIVTYAWCNTCSQLTFFAPVSKALGMHYTFFLYAGINFCGIIMAIIIPETKGKTVAEIEKILIGKK